MTRFASGLLMGGLEHVLLKIARGVDLINHLTEKIN